MAEKKWTFGRYRSRTYWLIWGTMFIASVLCYQSKIEGSGWVTVSLGLVAAWQLRRYGDNKLEGGNK